MNSIFDIVRRWFRFGSKQGSPRQRGSDVGRRHGKGNKTVADRVKAAPRPSQASGSRSKQAVVSEVTAELLQDLRSASENRVKGPLWLLPRVNTGDPQPMLKHQAEALARLSQNDFHSGVIHLPTGSGKTRVGIEIAAQCLEDPQGQSHLGDEWRQPFAPVRHSPGGDAGPFRPRNWRCAGRVLTTYKTMRCLTRQTSYSSLVTP